MPTDAELARAIRLSGHDPVRADGKLGFHHSWHRWGCVICKFLDSQVVALQNDEGPPKRMGQ